MAKKITGLIIDQTCLEGKWYARELKDHDGGVTTLFFRRKKTDWFGRLVDKLFLGAKSGQRYAASHFDALGFKIRLSHDEVFTSGGAIRKGVNERDKLTPQRLQDLIHQKQTQASKGWLPPPEPNAPVQQEDLLPVAVVLDNTSLRNEIRPFWTACRARDT